MKKILAILSGVVMMFTACIVPGGGETPQVNFPETQTLTVESGMSYEITFTAEKAWEVSLTEESKVYATLTYDDITDTQFFGEAGKESTIVVNVKSDIVSYAKDLVINVVITMNNTTNDLAVLTIPRTPYVINVMGAAPVGMEEFVQSTFERGGHPENGPFASVSNAYTVRYLNASDATYGDYVVYHDLDLLYNYVVYARDERGEFVAVAEDCPWLALRQFTKKVETTNSNGTKDEVIYQAFSLEMMHKKSQAVFTEGVGYEAYVNLVDENGDALVSVYFLYDPNAVPAMKPSVELAYPDFASAQGVTFVGEATMYTLTVPSLDVIVANNNALTLKITGWAGGGYTTPGLKLINSGDNIYCTVIEDGVDAANLLRDNNLTFAVTNAEGAKEYTISVVLDWIEAVVEETPEE